MPVTFIIRDALQENRLLNFLHRKLRTTAGVDLTFLDRLLDYIENYTRYMHLGKDDIIVAYTKFISQYDRDIKNFIRYKKYPFMLHEHPIAFTRMEYDLALMLSTILTYHRYRIMKLLNDKVIAGSRALIVGCGSGLEIELVKIHVEDLIAYDLCISDFVKTTRNVTFIERRFTGSGGDTFDRIFLIELLEHLADPYDLLAHCCGSLSPGGTIYLTTATNIPQFDHLYNFDADHYDFERRVRTMGVSIVFREDIKHQYITGDIDAKNVFYILKKNT